MSRRNRAGKWHSAWFLGLTLSAWAGSAVAQDTYESERTAAVVDREGLRALAPADAEGRPIQFIRIARDDVFVEDDGGLLGWLTWANIFHWLTVPEVIERELLLEEGEPYVDRLVEETMRNLRSLGIFSYVRIVPVATSGEGVGLLVYTRDLWSLRLEQNFQVTGTNVDSLLLQLSERNLFGQQKRASLRFFMVPDNFRFGQVYLDRRLARGTLSLGESFDLIFNRANGNVEGAAVGVGLSSPFYNLGQRFGFDVNATFVTEVERRIRNGQIVPYDVPGTPEEEAIPSVWRQRDLDLSVRGLYRNGAAYKQTMGAGFAVRDLSADPNAETGLEPGQEEAFRRDLLPRERRQIGPLLTYDLFTPDFETFENLASYGVTENVRNGPRVTAEVGFPLRLFGSSSDSIVFFARYGYVLAANDLLAEASVEAGSRLEDGDVVDQTLRAEFRGASPMIDFFRFVWRFTWEGRANDTSRRLVTLGGDNGLRGYVSQAFTVTGGNLLRGNLELRSAPFVLGSVHLGAVAFYDVGTVYETTDDIELFHSVGLGLRVLFPQFNRLPFRVDGAVPSDGSNPVPSFGSAQAVPITELEDSQAL